MHKTRRFYIYNGRQRKSHHLNVSVKKTLITHLDFDVTQKSSFYFQALYVFQLKKKKREMLKKTDMFLFMFVIV
jgi:hypothetical protein